MPGGMPALPGLDDQLEPPGGAAPADDSGAGSDELDPTFANDAGDALPDASDDQLLALQRAVLGLLTKGT